MKRALLIVFLCLFPVTAFAQAQIAFDAESYNFGTVSHEDMLEHVFEFTNAGDQELVIERVVPS
jgi:hypothetical protein